MKERLFLLSFVFFVPFCVAQTANPLSECQKFLTGVNTLGLLPDDCAMIVKPLMPGDHFLKITEDGNVEAEANGIQHEYHLSRKMMSKVLLQSDTESLINLKRSLDQNMINLGFDKLLAQGVEHWKYLRDWVCSLNPGSAYSDLDGNRQICPAEVLESSGSQDANIDTPFEPNHAFKIPPNVQGTQTCQKAITFAVMEGPGLSYRLPNISTKWLDKAQRKNPGICFTQYGAHSGEKNYLVVVSSSSSAYTGLQPVFHHSATVNPVSGSGTLTDNTGATWDFTYQGTVTTTTTAETNLPYTDTTGYLYANAYDETGSLVGSSERSVSSRQGGDQRRTART